MSRFLVDPDGFGRRALRVVRHVAVEALPWLVGIALVVLTVVAVVRLLRARRDRAVRDGARRIRIFPPPQVDPQSALVLWMGLHALLRPWWRRIIDGQPHLSWEITGRPEEVEVALWVPRVVPPGLIERAVEVAFPGAQVVRAESDPLKDLGARAESTELALAEADWFPIAAPPSEDPLALALASLTGLDDGESAAIQVLARPAVSHARRRFRRAAHILRAGGGRPTVSTWRTGRGKQGYRPAPDPSVEQDVRAILGKAASPLWECVVRLAVSSPDIEKARGRIHALAGAYAVFEGRNGFRRRRSRGGIHLMQDRALRKPYLLSVPELAQLATLAPAGAVAGLERAGARTVPPPRAVPATGKVLGVSDHSAIRRSVAISVEDARHHFHVIGETGTGKSTLLAQLVLQDAEAGRAAVVVDPKGDLVQAILERLPPGAEERTCVLDPDDKQTAVGLNVLAGEDDDLVVDHVLGVFKRIYEPWWGPRTDDIMRAACLTLKQVPGATLAEVPLLLSHQQWRRELRERVADVVGIGAFWTWYERLPEQQRAIHIAPLLNKLRAFLLRGPVRAIVGQAESRLDIGALLDSGGLLLVRIPKGTLGEETSRLLGAFAIARIWQACMRRADRPEEERRDVTLYVDEMHNYLALPRSFEDLLAEARGYRLSLVLAHQHLGQLPREMREALAANARTKIVFACSPDDAHQLQRHFAPELTDHDLSHLAAYQAACRPCVGGGQSAGFTFRTNPLPAGDTARADSVRSSSAERFGVERSTIEERIVDRHMYPEKHLLPITQTRGQQGSQPVGQSLSRSRSRP